MNFLDVSRDEWEQKWIEESELTRLLLCPIWITNWTDDFVDYSICTKNYYSYRSYDVD